MSDAPAIPALHLIQRRLAARFGAAAMTGDAGALETRGPSSLEPPRLSAAPVIEGHALRAVRVEGDPEAAIAAFLDGTQHSRVVCHHEGLPIVFGTVAAVVRERRNRRLTTWRRPRVARRLYAPCAYLPDSVASELRALAAVVDTTAAPDAALRPSRHPLALLERALAFVKADREFEEKTLAEEWCRTERSPLLVDGGIQGSQLVAESPCVLGVVKSHRTFYADGDALRVILGLRRGQRSSVVRLASSRRTAVASWYLRLRDPSGRDPMWGLVRVEAALVAGESPRGITERADLLSRWILAEVAPLALPDGRWDKLVYGIRDCEEFLRAVC